MAHQQALLGRCASHLPFTSGPRPVQRRAAIRQPVAVRSAAPGGDGMQEMMKKAMTDPVMAKQLEEVQKAMQTPEAQQQMAQMQAVMGNQQLQARMQQLRGDPEFKAFFDEIATGGMQALTKYYNDPEFLLKLNAKVGTEAGAAAAAAGAQAPPNLGGAAQGPPSQAPQAQAPEIKDLLDAARYGDLEAVEDFISIGKDVAMKDKENRTPLHFSSGSNHVEITSMLIAEGAPLEAVDQLGNTPLHYAAGYGRPDVVALLLEKGACKTVKNKQGNTPYDLATKDPRNPVSKDADLVASLKP